MTTIDIQFTNMSNNQAPSGVKVRILQDHPPTLIQGGGGGGKTEANGGDTNRQSPRLTRSLYNKRPPIGYDPMVNLEKAFQCYNPSMFTITAYLPDEEMEGEKRLKLQCYPGMTVQEVIDSQIPSVSHKPYVVYQFPSRALLNPEKEASVLQDQEIWIEPARIDTSEDIGDERLAVVKELCRTEDAYLEHLKNIFDVYMEPMRKWGIAQADMNVLFRPLSQLCDLLMNFFSELELAVKSWNTNNTLIGGLFTQYHSYWDMYIEYAQSYTIAMKLLKQLRKDESFSKFLDTKRGAAMHTLESLMLLPVQRVSDYQRYLTQLLSLTPRDHPDYQNIRVTVARTDEIIQARADELVYLQNESKLEQVQLQFPNDQLFLFDKLDLIDASTTPKRSRSVSHTPVSTKGMHSSSFSTPTKQKSTTNCSTPDFTDGPTISSSSSSSSAQSRKKLRMYIQEGPVKLLVMNKQGLFQPQDRYLFLFSDLLLVAKSASKSRTQQNRIFRLKKRLRLSEMWVSESIDAVLPPHDNQSAFTLGWPINNCIALFSSAPLKVLWYNSLLKHVNLQRQLAVSDSVSIRIINMIKPNSNQFNTSSPTSQVPEFLQVHFSETCVNVLKNALKRFKNTEPLSEFQLWVKLAREDKEELLQGYECIFAIQANHNRQQLEFSNDSHPQQLEFVVRRKSPLTSSASRGNIFKRMKGGRKKMSIAKAPKQVKMFGVPLEELIINNQLPEKLQEILIRLWVDGPTTSGIFRLNGNAKRIREVREAIDGRKMVDLSDEGIHVISSLLKELLRNVPGGILNSSRYTEFVATNDIEDELIRIQNIRKVLNKLPLPNQVFLRYLLPLLYHIAQFEDINQMSTTNLAICFAPSLLEPEYSLAVIKNEAPTLVEYMIRHAMEIYNNELPELFRQVEAGTSESEREMGPPIHYVPVKDDDDTEISDCGGDSTRKYYHQRNMSIESNCTSASEDSLDEDETLQRRLRHINSDTEELSVLGSSRSGRVTLLSDRSEGVSTGIEGDMSDIDDEEEYERGMANNKWSASKGRQYTPNWGSSGSSRHDIITARRHSHIPQLVSHSAKHYSPDISSSKGPPSPTRSRGSSHSSNSPMFPHRILDPADSDGSTRNSGHRSESSAVSHKKRRKPGHSNSFSKASDIQQQQHSDSRLPQSTSFSYYDSLLPVDGSRPRSSTVATTTAVRPSPPPSTVTRDLSASLELGTHGSNQSVNSRGSGSSGGSQTRTNRQQQPQLQQKSNSSLASSHHSGGGDDDMGGATTPLSTKLDSEFIKHAISNRFNLTSGGGGVVNPNTSTPTPSTNKDKDIKEEISTGGGRMRRDENRKYMYPSYQQRKQHMKSVDSIESNTSTIDDDRPEAERHLNSLPRANPPNSGGITSGYQSQTSTGSLGRRSIFGPAEMMPLGYSTTSSSQDSGSRLTILSGGYNSDTESSPSRTLNRPEKIQEVSSPNTPRSIPSRYSKYEHTHSSSSLRSMDSIERPPSIEENSPLSIDDPLLVPTTLSQKTPLVEPSLAVVTSRTRSSTVAHDSYTSKESSKNNSNKGLESGQWKESVSNARKRSFTSSLGTSENTTKTSESASSVKALSKSFEEPKVSTNTSQPVPVPHIGTKQLGVSSFELKSRSMPNHNARLSLAAARTSSNAPPQVKTERVIRYELPVPKKIRRINLRAYNTK